MKRSLLLLAAVALAVFGALVALDVIEFDTDRIDRWVMIFSGAGVVVLIGLLSAGSVAADPDDAAAVQKLNEGRVDPADLPSKPGSLLRQNRPEPGVASEADENAPVADLPTRNALDLDLSSSDTSPAADPTTVLVPTVDEAEDVTIDPVDAELQELIDEDQMHEITALVSAAETETESETEEHTDLVAGGDSVEPLARLELRLADYDDEDLQRVVKQSESVVISEMVRTGQLSSAGELTEKDIASMIFLAYTSEEMLTELRLRKSLDHSGLEASTGNDFAPLKNIE